MSRLFPWAVFEAQHAAQFSNPREGKPAKSGPKLDHPPRARQAYLKALELERQESGERNEIEGCIGVCKRRYGLDLVMMRLKHTSEVGIHVSILTRNLV